MTTSNLNQRGFTLVELMVATVVTSMLILIVMTFLVNTVATNIVYSTQSDMLREAQITLDNIGNEIRLSGGADEENRWEDENAPGAPSDELSWQSDADTLILATAALNSSKDILFSDPLHYVTSKNNNIYFTQNGTLYKRTLADPIAGNSAVNTCPPSPSDSCVDDRELVHDVTEFSIRYFDNQNNQVAPSVAQSVEITLELDKVKYGKNISADYTTRTVFRNE